ncbi:MAG: amidophosphoribosyltransferase [Candidatus Heimdallarchaeota archaeon]|nr:amidophosphoribosyltransferase [Candidatus Heimdallarchaeota archaeon]
MSIKDHCGIIGIRTTKRIHDLGFLLYQGLLTLQHRGQSSAGITVVNKQNMKTISDLGYVQDIFDKNTLAALKGKVGIGHVRYPTAGSDLTIGVQPFVLQTKTYKLAIAFNGTVSNYEEVRNYLMSEGFRFSHDTDTEVIGKLLDLALEEKNNDMLKACEVLIKKLDGAYSILIVTDKGEMVAFRDPLGFKPLCYGKSKEGDIVIASETIGLTIVGAKFEADVKPGEILIVTEKSLKKKQLIKNNFCAHCMFEWVYFARPDAVMDGISAYEARERIGKSLGTLFKEQGYQADIVVPIPDSGRIAAIGFSKETGIEYSEALIRNRYIGRTFIMPRQTAREEAVKVKLNVLSNLIKGKRVVLVDDSIVRGTTSRGIIKMIRDAGAAKVYFAISCPKLINPCFMGTDFPTERELIACGRTDEQIAEIIGVDAVIYNTIPLLVDSIGFDKWPINNNLCLACLTGDYPIKEPPSQGLCKRES